MPRKRRKTTPYGIRGKTTSKICDMMEEQCVFDSILYKGPCGQPGVFVELRKGEFEAVLRREGFPSSDGYNATSSNSIDSNKDHPTRITFLSISKRTKVGGVYETTHYGTYDPKELKITPKHKFEEDAKDDPKLEAFLKDILDNFNVI